MKDDAISRDSFVFYRSFMDSIGMLPDGAQIVLLRAVIAYGLNQAIPDFSGVADQQYIEAIFAVIRPQLDANHKRFVNGCKGGAPKGNQNARKQPKNNLKQPNVNDNVNDNVNVKGVQGNKSLSMPFSNQEFVDTWNVLRDQPKWRKKSNTALQMNLNKLSGYDVRFAIELMNTAIANDWQGLIFDDTPARYEKWKQSHPDTTGQPHPITDINDIYNE